jgi:hypothetical protein
MYVINLIVLYKYNKLRKELQERRKEVEQGNILSHDEIWQDFE